MYIYSSRGLLPFPPNFDLRKDFLLVSSVWVSVSCFPRFGDVSGKFQWMFSLPSEVRLTSHLDYSFVFLSLRSCIRCSTKHRFPANFSRAHFHPGSHARFYELHVLRCLHLVVLHLLHLFIRSTNLGLTTSPSHYPSLIPSLHSGCIWARARRMSLRKCAPLIYARGGHREGVIMRTSCVSGPPRISVGIGKPQASQLQPLLQFLWGTTNLWLCKWSVRSYISDNLYSPQSPIPVRFGDPQD